MRRLQLAGLVLAALVVLTLVGSLLRGLGGEGGAAESAGPEATGSDPRRVRVEVLNAAGVPGLARAATERLREQGFDVVYYGNASGVGPDTSWVLDRVGVPETAERVSDALRIERTRTELDTTLYVDVSVVLGRDWPVPESPADTAGSP